MQPIRVHVPSLNHPTWSRPQPFSNGVSDVLAVIKDTLELLRFRGLCYWQGDVASKETIIEGLKHELLVAIYYLSFSSLVRSRG
jgi:hypothetical protein